MSLLNDTGDIFRDAGHLAPDQEVSRGRKRSRSSSRVGRSRSLRPDESSTLRGRSPRRATSPFPLPSRNTSPSILRSPTSQILLYNQLRRVRREHCPSRTASPGDRSLRRSQRTRSRSRGPRRDHEPVRSPDIQSSLRNEVLYEHQDGSKNTVQQ
ncbi:branched-chain amino acid aminotransferase [Pochonia chlamydosporia 170]|uniref:Branched-chain amino acid aminotransferase n=1 Tax=Pochonia chlamydosporia 170 TaxID=1380566 RepID=A0A179FTH2_METCM|nr:branched-chain amino acid aminotransferase [Pochonia chlamydosporia 170]OAQ68946.1 branched-chain amino acid aminotransferase [Pochonia chlamydosporia 170]